VSSIDVYGGVIAPGNSIGTLSVAGPATFHAGSTFEVEVNGRGEGDRLAVGGVATLAGQVHVIPQFGLYALATDYKIITAASLAGQFDGVTSDLAFLVPSLRYGAQDVTLHLDRNGNAFGTFAGTPNQVFVAEAAERLGAGNAVFNALLGSSIPQAQQAFAQLSGDVHGGAPALIQTGSGLFTTALTDRLWIGQSSAFHSSAEPLTTGAIPGAAAVPVRDLDPQHFALWGEALGAIGQAKGGGGSAGLDQSTAGFALGADVGVDDWRLGVAGGFTRTNFDTSGGLQSGDVDSVHGALYGAAAFGQVRLRAGTSFASADIAATRTITIPGISGSYRADYNGRTYQAFAEAGYRFDLACMLAEFGAAGLEPFVKGTVGRAVTDRFAEEGGAAALVGFANDATFSTTTLGVHADLQPSSTSPLTLRATLGWRHAFGEVAPNVLLAFRDGGSAFAIAGAPADRDALAAQMNVGWTFNRSMRFDLTYAGVLGQNAQEHSASGRFSVRF
jgi:outer membrane autotransporter protein